MSLREDERAVAPVIGAVLIFGMLVVSLSSYQAFVVPNENQQVEYDHDRRVQSQLVAVRNAILDARATREEAFATVELGTRYSSRLIAINPPSPTGRLATTDLEEFTVSDADRDAIEACPGTEETRALEYRANYNEYRNAPTIRYEHSVVYGAHDNGADVPLSGQTLVRDDTITLVPVRGEFQESGTRAVAVEPKPGRMRSTRTTDPTIALPTRLDEETWVTLLDGQVAEENVAVADGTLTIDLEGEYTVRCGPVGIGETPPSGPAGSDEGGLNPAAPADIVFEGEYMADGTSSEVVLMVNNTANANAITEARINFYQSAESADRQTPDRATIAEDGGDPSAELVFREDFEVLDPKIDLPGERVTRVRLDFSNPDTDDPTLSDESFFVLTIVLETGESATFFVPVPTG